jgi:gliding motility-associated-like protein
VTANNTDCTLSDATLNLTVIGAAFPQNLSIKWENTYNVNDPSITTTEPQLDNAYPGFYVIEVSDLTSGCKTYGAAEVTNYMLRLNTTINSITPSTNCLPSNGAVDISVTGGAGTYQYYWSRTDGVPFSAATQDVSGLEPGQYRFEVVDTGAGCSALEDLEVPDNTVGLSVTRTIVPNSRCSAPFNGSVSLNISGTAGPYSYEWVDEFNYVVSTQPSLTDATPGAYGVTVTDNITGCSFTIPPDQAEGIIIPDTSLPAITIDQVISGNKSCNSPYSGSINLTITTAPTYTVQWYGPFDFNSTQEDLINLRAGEYYLMVTLPCGDNSPPLIDPPPFALQNETSLTIDLLDFISDPDNNLDPSSLEILDQPISGAAAQINQSHQLLLNYQDITFNGMDQLRIQACDDLSACTENILTIDVDVTATGEIQVFNAVAPNSTGDNKYMRILNIPQENKVIVFNRWGDKVFEASNYDNQSRKFEGLNDNGKALPSGTYFYKIELPNGEKSITGYLSLKQ